MFETFLEGQAADPRLRPRRFVAAVLAATVVAVGLSTFFVGEKMGITQVTAPHIEHVLVTQVGVQPPPPAKVPDRPKTSEPPKQTPPDNPAIVPTTPVDETPDPSQFMEPTRRTQPDSTGGGSQHGQAGGDGDPLSTTTGVACLGVQCKLGKSPPRRIPPTQPPEPEEDEVKTLRWMKAQAIFSPEPDTNLLNQTPTGRGPRTPGTVAVSFCVDKRGKVVHAKIARSFGDREVDRICRQAVNRWRFRPALLAGTAKRTCSEAVFEIVFD